MAKTKKNALTSVTPASRLLALVLFLILPFIGFVLGIQYEKMNARNQLMEYGTLAE